MRIARREWRSALSCSVFLFEGAIQFDNFENHPHEQNGFGVCGLSAKSDLTDHPEWSCERINAFPSEVPLSSGRSSAWIWPEQKSKSSFWKIRTLTERAVSARL